METVFVGDKNTAWYKKCRDYLDDNKVQFEKVEAICEKYGIDKHDVALSHDTLYLNYGKEYPQDVVKMFKSAPYICSKGSFYVVKRNSKLGKEIINAGVDKKSSPMVGFDLFRGITGVRYGQFIHNEHVYIRIVADRDVECPEGFEVMSMSDFWALIEKIQDKSNGLKLENI